MSACIRDKKSNALGAREQENRVWAAGNREQKGRDWKDIGTRNSGEVCRGEQYRWHTAIKNAGVTTRGDASLRE